MKKWSCLDREGRPIPWYTYPAIEYLASLDLSGMKVLEYGSGNSSLWWAERCKELVSVENDRAWYENIKNSAPVEKPFSYLFETSEQPYVRQPCLEGADIVIVDGVYRPRCIDWFIESEKNAKTRAALLIFDNSDWYPKTVARLRKALNWIEVDFHGFGPINAYTWTTSIFFRPEYQERLQYARPLSSVAGIVQAAAEDA